MIIKKLFLIRLEQDPLIRIEKNSYQPCLSPHRASGDTRRNPTPNCGRYQKMEIAQEVNADFHSTTKADLKHYDSTTPSK